MDHNRLTEIPAEIGNLKKLRNLHAYDNDLASLPKEIGTLENLTKLYVNHNQLVRIPEEIGNLSNLIVFQANSNQLKEVPTKLGNLKNLITLEIDDNPFEKELKGIRTIELLKYLRFVSELRVKAITKVKANSLLLELILDKFNHDQIPQDVINIKTLIMSMLFIYFLIQILKFNLKF